MLIGPDTAELLIGDADAPRPAPVMLSGLLPLWGLELKLRWGLK